MDFLNNIEYWHWWIAGIALGIAEMFLPRRNLIWFGVAAFITGFIVALSLLSWVWQLGIFVVVSVIMVVVSKHMKFGVSQTSVNTDMQETPLSGQIYTTDTPIIDGRATITVNGEARSVRLEDFPQGTRVSVVGEAHDELVVKVVE
ncbi:MAG: NfeD family protein [Gammaproteobacteria bacterium]|nr:NfeD family protein [Gammaproteobacteria bacterium]